jgi:cell division protein ZapD
MMDVAARADLKSDVLKDLDKHKNVFNSYRGNPGDGRSRARPGRRPARAQLHRAQRHAGQGRPVPDRERVAHEHPQPRRHSGRHLRVRPARLLRLAAPRRAQRRADLERWANTLAPLAESIHLLLKLLRDSGTCPEGDGQPASSSRTCRRAAPSSCCACASTPLGLVPEISGNRLMVSVRLMRQEADDRLHQSTEDAPFELTLCA